ncbi:MAG: aminoacyl-tRNA hydrolase [Xanthomonadales bacterium]|nr:aminoacyl-tRNA hydrolase [Xanthomonadales bacterium]
MSDRLLIVGLGNPGLKYAETRHNAGFWFLERLLRVVGVGLKAQARQQAESATVNWQGRDLVLARPTTFMNHSGQAVRALVDFYRIAPEHILVAYDELDLPPGVARLKTGGGHGGHNGIRDMIRHLGTPEFHRLRIGIGHPGNKDAVTRYVLGRSPAGQRSEIDAAIDRAVDVMPLVIGGRMQDAMTRLHTQN